jgi:glycerol kinase
VAWRLRDRTAYCVDGQVYTAASAVRWAVDLGLVPAADQIDSFAADSSAGVLCVPALAGLAAPWWDSAAAASFSGMTLSSGRGHLVRALLEGIAAQVAALAGLVASDLAQPLTRLRVDGGLTQSAVLMQAQADLAGIPVDVYPSLHATALGAAACARLALDTGLDVADAVGTWTPDHTYEPEWTAERADEFMSRWRLAAESVLVQKKSTSR